MEEQLSTRTHEFQGGVPVFTGTRIPVKYFFDYSETGEALD